MGSWWRETAGNADGATPSPEAPSKVPLSSFLLVLSSSLFKCGTPTLPCDGPPAGQTRWGWIRRCLPPSPGVTLPCALPEEYTTHISWHRTLGFSAVICLGSILVLFPAWLPRSTSVAAEDGAVELLQLALLSTSAAFLLAASSHAGRFKPIYRAMSLCAMAAAVAEFEDGLNTLISSRLSSWLFLPFLVMALYYFLRYKRETLRFTALASRHPASGFIAAGLIIIYVFSRFFGSSAFWDATLEADFDPELPRICRSYLELLACYFIAVGTIGFCLPVSRRAPAPS